MKDLITNGNLIPYLLYTSYVLYIILYLGVSYIDPYYASSLEVITQIYIAGSLLYYFNPFITSSRMKTITPNMRELIFTAGFVLLINNIGKITRMTREAINKVKESRIIDDSD